LSACWQVNVSSYLRLLCLAEDTRTDPRDVSTLLSLNGCDIRQSLLQLQFWTCSTGGRHRDAKQPDPSDSLGESCVCVCVRACVRVCVSLSLCHFNHKSPDSV